MNPKYNEIKFNLTIKTKSIVHNTCSYNLYQVYRKNLVPRVFIPVGLAWRSTIQLIDDVIYAQESL